MGGELQLDDVSVLGARRKCQQKTDKQHFQFSLAPFEQPPHHVLDDGALPADGAATGFCARRCFHGFGPRLPPGARRVISSMTATRSLLRTERRSSPFSPGNVSARPRTSCSSVLSSRRRIQPRSGAGSGTADSLPNWARLAIGRRDGGGFAESGRSREASSLSSQSTETPKW